MIVSINGASEKVPNGSDMRIIHVCHAGEEKQKEGCIQRALVKEIKE
jgi:hypothetical protein